MLVNQELTVEEFLSIEISKLQPDMQYRHSGRNRTSAISIHLRFQRNYTVCLKKTEQV
jgi:hypothetical protein